jgi:hypothetical protein
MPARPLFRLARAVVFATVCVALAAGGHLAAGMPVSPGSAGAGLTIVVGVGLLMAGRERSLRTIVGGVLAGQFGLHALFAQAAGGGGHHHAPEALTHSSSGRPAMTVAHVSAALVTAWWLRRGEAVIWRLARRIAAAIRPLPPAAAPRPVSPPAPVPPDDPPLRRSPTPLRHVVILRGPPADLSALYV